MIDYICFKKLANNCKALWITSLDREIQRCEQLAQITQVENVIASGEFLKLAKRLGFWDGDSGITLTELKQMKKCI